MEGKDPVTLPLARKFQKRTPFISEARSPDRVSSIIAHSKRSITGESVRVPVKDENPKLKVVLSEFKGVVVEVFEAKRWFTVLDENGKNRWGFEGHVADESIREKYINRQITKRNYGNPVRYSL